MCKEYIRNETFAVTKKFCQTNWSQYFVFLYFSRANYFQAWAQFCCKMWGYSLVWNQYSHRVDAEVMFYIYRFSILFLEVFARATLITLCFVLADDLHLNMLKFVVGHGAVVQPASINIVFGYKQAQQYNRIHQLGFIRVVSRTAQNAESHRSHVHITLIVEHFNFHAFYEKCELQRDLMSCSSRFNVTKTINIFLAR